MEPLRPEKNVKSGPLRPEFVCVTWFAYLRPPSPPPARMACAGVVFFEGKEASGIRDTTS